MNDDLKPRLDSRGFFVFPRCTQGTVKPDSLKDSVGARHISPGLPNAMR
jgi:hypothetical protein